MSEISVAVLAGGVGKRFWPLSNEDQPKQFLSLLSPDPMIIETLKRLTHTPFTVRAAYVLTHQRYQSWFEDHPFFKKPPFPIEFIYEPLTKNTLAPITWLAHHIAHTGARETPCIVLPADHWISPTDIFHQQISELIDAAHTQTEPWIYVIGIPPTAPSTDYGYIECAADTANMCDVVQFREKPDQQTAVKYIQSGHFLWNAGIFFFRPMDLLSIEENAAPEVVEALPRGVSAKEMRAFWEKAPNTSIDYGLLEKTKQRRCLRAQFLWNDIGTWDGLARWEQATGSKSPYHRHPTADSSESNIVYADHDEHIVMLGCQDLYVIHGRKQCLIAHKDYLYKIKDIVDKLFAK